VKRQMLFPWDRLFDGRQPRPFRRLDRKSNTWLPRFGAVFLIKSQQDCKKDDDGDGLGLKGVTKESRQRHSAKQNHDKNIAELR
jgi:hypothetical protein